MKSKLIAIVGVVVAVVVVAVVAILVGGLAVGGDDNGTAGKKAVRSGGPTTVDTTDSDPGTTTDPEDPAFKAALSKPVEDSLYPNVGDPIVDSLHYGLDLTWDPEDKVLTGRAEVAFRATASQQEFQLDFGEGLEVTAATLDAQEVEVTHVGKDLVIKAPVTKDQRYLLVVDYEGTPEPADAPTTRSDFSTTGFTITDDGDVWTMQEPYGAYTWYPVNDQPSDKAFYDFTITTPAPRVGIANGQLTSQTEVDGNSVSRWHLDSAASSYLITLAIGEYEQTEDTSASGVPLTYWTAPGDARALKAMKYTKRAVDWLEEKLGPYPFSSLGSVVVDSESAMETQQMITYGDSDYTLSPDVVVHEIAHQWYGDITSPSDWKDVWINEGMAMYVQGVFEAQQTGRTVDDVMDEWATWEKQYRATAGPPGNYDPRTFGESNIYYGPALMWHELRKKLGDEKFWAMVRAWPTVHKQGNPTREEYLDWIEQETGEELTDFFDAWLMGEKTPKRS
ncbi:M1 family metallopeptidase [Nocardioides jensenii]|uniref:M1 family metallopeptidase n=1 Tax=Nocardioides jensenii TaxID=1843 RepID=UPI000836EE61|nr:M1 family metallopeptidase [Nocardioides jensenii]